MKSYIIIPLALALLTVSPLFYDVISNTVSSRNDNRNCEEMLEKYRRVAAERRRLKQENEKGNEERTEQISNLGERLNY